MGMSTVEPLVTATTQLGAPAPDVWAHATTEEGVNDELRPVMRMTMPKAFKGKRIDDVEVGEPLGRSWVLLFGVIPFDYDDLCLVELEPGTRFLERSQMLSMRMWQHEREVVPEGAGCRLTDRVSFELRRPLVWIPGMSRVAAAMIRRVFAHRHRRLVARWGSPLN
jgi:ligand-binding SRPBCC domain-containing protein